MRRTMITIPAFNNLQQESPETKIVSIYLAYNGFCSVGIEPPAAIKEYFASFLAKARRYTDGHECKVVLFSDGRLDLSLVIPDRSYVVR